MVKRIGGTRRKSRHKLLKESSEKGKISLRRYFQKLIVGDRVRLSIEPAIQKGDYHLRFHNHSGVIEGMKGRCYIVRIKDFNKEKILILHPVHLKKV